MFTQFAIVAGLAAAALSPNEPVRACPEDEQASAITYELAGLPPEVRDDLIRETRGAIGERPRPLRLGDVITPENKDHLTVRFYQALRFRGA